MECFAWRERQTAKQVGAFAGLTPTPSPSGQASRELGITQAGNGYLRPMAVELAWGWVRFQPESRLTQWDQARCGQGSARRRQIGMVALARKLLLALWHFLERGEVPAGAILKAEAWVYRVQRVAQARGERTRFWLVRATRCEARVRRAHR
jgi:transposase